MPRGKIFIINPSGEVAHSNPRYRHSYRSMAEMADAMFPCIDDGSAELNEVLGRKPPLAVVQEGSTQSQPQPAEGPALAPPPPPPPPPSLAPSSEGGTPAAAPGPTPKEEEEEQEAPGTVAAAPADVERVRAAPKAPPLVGPSSEPSPRRFWRQGERSTMRLGRGSVAEEDFNVHNYWKVDRRSLTQDSSDEEAQ